MGQRLKQIFFYFVYWLLFFQAGRILFFIITREQLSAFGAYEFFGAMLFGLWLDASISGYLTLLLCLFFIVQSFVKTELQKVFKFIHALLLFVSALGIISNAVLYTYWSSPLDINAIRFLKTPLEAAASINWVQALFPIFLGIVLFYVFIKFYHKVLPLSFKNIGLSKAKFIGQTFVLLLAAGLCIIPIRGGFGIVPVNLSYVYFQNEIYPNHAAYNPIWNVLYSWMEAKKESDFHYMEDALAQDIFDDLYQIPQDSIFLLDSGSVKPNVLILVLESYMSKLVNLKYKGEVVCPYLNTLSRQGIYFSNLYASGDRSDKGLASIFSGYPALPKSSILQFPEKFNKLPSLFKDFKAAGYSNAFYYGGNLDFANLKSYFLSAGAEKIVVGKDMPSELARGRWGVHDAPMFRQLSEDIPRMKEPFFTGFFTLSNHEPFDIPVVYHFGKSNGDEEYMSAARYTDDCIKEFMEEFKKTTFWNNTLVVLVADHGVTRLGVDEVLDADKFHIPMVWTGGIVKEALKIETVISHTDIPAILLNQLKMQPVQDYIFSKSNLNLNKGFASYFYNNGIGFVNSSGPMVYDNVENKCREIYPCKDSLVRQGKAYLQVLSHHFNHTLNAH